MVTVSLIEFCQWQWLLLEQPRYTQGEDRLFTGPRLLCHACSGVPLYTYGFNFLLSDEKLAVLRHVHPLHD